MPKIINSLNSFSKALKKNKVVGNHSKIIDDSLFSNNGSGSFVLDFLTRGKISKSKKYRDMQRKLSDLDMKLGGKAYDFLDKRKNKTLNSLKKTLVQEHDILKQKGIDGLSDEYIKLKRTGITNPISKTKDTVLPIVGAMTVGSKVFPGEKEEKDLNESNYNNYYE